MKLILQPIYCLIRKYEALLYSSFILKVRQGSICLTFVRWKELFLFTFYYFDWNQLLLWIFFSAPFWSQQWHNKVCPWESSYKWSYLPLPWWAGMETTGYLNCPFYLYGFVCIHKKPFHSYLFLFPFSTLQRAPIVSSDGSISNLRKVEFCCCFLKVFHHRVNVPVLKYNFNLPSNTPSTHNISLFWLLLT